MTNARIGWGGKVYLSTDNTEANLTLLAEVVSVTFPQGERDEVDVTHLASPEATEEIILGIKRGGESTATFNYDPGSATDLLLTAALETFSQRKIRMVVPDESGTGAADWNFVATCRVKRYGPDEMSPGAKISATAVFRYSGAIEQGAGASGS
jgi:hypothetical protein